MVELIRSRSAGLILPLKNTSTCAGTIIILWLAEPLNDCSSRNSMMLFSLLSSLALPAFSASISAKGSPILPTASQSIALFNPSSLNLTSSPLSQWPPAPIILHISEDLEAVIEQYQTLSSNPHDVAATSLGLQRIEVSILEDPDPMDPQEPFLACSGPVLFMVEFFRPLGPNIKEEVAHIVHFLGLFTTSYQAATIIDHGELRLVNHHSPQPGDIVAEFALLLNS